MESATTTKLISVGAFLIAAAWACDVIVHARHPTFVNGDIGYSVTLVVLLPVVAHFGRLSEQAWKVIRVITVLLAIPLGLWASPPMMDVPVASEWNTPLAALHYVMLIASFAVAFLLVRVEMFRAHKTE